MKCRDRVVRTERSGRRASAPASLGQEGHTEEFVGWCVLFLLRQLVVWTWYLWGLSGMLRYVGLSSSLVA